MAKLWITYAWDDNANFDVDFVAQELRAEGLDVSLDRSRLGAGRRLWEQIDSHIQSPDESDAWLIYATQNSLRSEPCKEEFAYALDRALRARNESFPIIALFPNSVDVNLLPVGLRIRKCVSLSDPDWKEIVLAAAEKRIQTIAFPKVEAFYLARHSSSDGRHIIEVRPRAGEWSPFFAAIPLAEKEKVDLTLAHAPAGKVGNVMFAPKTTWFSTVGNWHLIFSLDAATPTQSYFLYVRTLPSQLQFGAQGGPEFLTQLR